MHFPAPSPPALVLLAAGGSTRMGRSKQLLPYRGTTLLGHSAAAALKSRCRPVVVVVGCEAQAMREALADEFGVGADGKPLQIVENPSWGDGMGTSIRVGVRAVLQDGPASAIIIMLCDQPGVSGEILDDLVERYEQDRPPIVASFYGGISGVPALFDRAVFDELLRLPDSRGARAVIESFGERVVRIAFPLGSIDVDTMDAYVRLPKFD